MTARCGSSAVSGVVSLPVLLECDWTGRVVGMSDRTRLALGAPASVADLLRLRNASPRVGIRLFLVLRFPKGFLLAAEMEDIEPLYLCHAVALRELEMRLLHGYFRLQAIERRLSGRALRMRRGGGRIAIRQIELERHRLASELHTGVGQMLAAIRLQLDVVTSQMCDAPTPVRQALDNIASLAGGALDRIRSVSRRLHPPEWQRLTIEDALEQLWNLSGIPLTFDADLRLPPLNREPDQEVKALLYRAAQEGISNIIAYSKAKKVTMMLTARNDLLVLTLQDDGVGFDPAAAARAPASLAAGIGLRSLASQATALGAKFEVESGRNGTKLVLSTQFSLEL